MKTIVPVNVWFNGQQVQASVLGAVASNDNLINLASFSYQLLQIVNVEGGYENLIPVASGILDMTGEVYQNWETNDYAYDWIATQLNLTITGEYIKPIPTTTSTTTEAPSTTTTSTTKA